MRTKGICKCKLPAGSMLRTCAPALTRWLVLHLYLPIVCHDLACRGAAQPVGGYLLYRHGRAHPCDMRMLREYLDKFIYGERRHTAEGRRLMMMMHWDGCNHHTVRIAMPHWQWRTHS